MSVIKKGVQLKATLFDDADDYYYLGYVAPNSKAETKTQCIIERIDKESFEITCAGGSHAYDKEWDLRVLSYSYLQHDGTEDPS